MLERSLSENSVEAYIRDVNKLVDYLSINGIKNGLEGARFLTV